MIRHNFKEGDTVYNLNTHKFYRIEEITNNGSYKLRGLYDNKFMWSAFNDGRIVAEQEATL